MCEFMWTTLHYVPFTLLGREVVHTIFFNLISMTNMDRNLINWLMLNYLGGVIERDRVLILYLYKWLAIWCANVGYVLYLS